MKFPSGGASWTLDPHNSMKVGKNPESVLLVCGVFCILTSCANTFLIPITSSVLDQYSHANRYMSFHQQFFSEVIFCYEKKVTSLLSNFLLKLLIA